MAALDLLHPQVEAYLQELSRHNDPVMARMEERAAATGFPIIGPVAGRALYQAGRMLGARRIFELGSGYGYSTLWFARAVADNGGGEIYHTVWDEGLSRDARRYLAEAGVDHLVRFRVSEAVAALRETPGPFDLIFNDIEKDAYPASLPIIKDRLRPGGALIVDNMLWGGRVLGADSQGAHTNGIREMTRLIYSDPDFFASLIPLRDGMVVAIRK